MKTTPNRCWYQFSLRSLFFASIATTLLIALWWSHRLHCLERSEYHRLQSEFYSARFDQVVEESEAEDLAQYHEAVDRLRHRSLRWEDQTINDSIGQGYLIAPVEDNAMPNSSKDELPPSSNDSVFQDESLLVLKEKLRLLADKAKSHDKLRANYLRAIYRPWVAMEE